MKQLSLTFSLCLFLILKSFGQGTLTANFPVLFQGLSSCPECDIFKPTCPSNANYWAAYPNLTIKRTHGSNVQEIPISGGGVSLNAKTVTGTPITSTGAGFYIKYHFSPDASYNIRIKAGLNGNTDPSIASLVFQLANGVPASTGACATTQTPVVPSGVSRAPMLINVDYTGNTSTQNDNGYHLLAGESYEQLFIYAQGKNIGTADFIVQYVQITEHYEFSFPQTLTVTCGSGAQTFTVTNPNNIANVTGYTWQVGSGWLYNGAPAPATISTGAGVNSIQLTPSGTSIPQNITVTPITGTTNYATYTCAITQTPMTTPTWSTFSSTLCSQTGTYAINPVPSATSYTWSDNSGSLKVNGLTLPATLSAATTSVTLTSTTPTFFSSNLSVVASSPGCGSSAPLTSQVQNGVQDYLAAISDGKGLSSDPTYIENGQASFCVGPVRIDILGGGGIIPITWTKIAGNIATITPGVPAGTFVKFTIGSNTQWITVRASSSSACGTKTEDFSIYGQTCTGGGLGLTAAVADSSGIQIYPNPATQYITIADDSKTTDVEKTVTIYDLNNNIVLKKVVDVKDYRVDVSNLKKGQYFVEVKTKYGKKVKHVILK